MLWQKSLGKKLGLAEFDEEKAIAAIKLIGIQIASPRHRVTASSRTLNMQLKGTSA